MERHFVQELENLKTQVLRMGSMAEQSVELSIKAVLERREDLARQVLSQEERINAFEIEIDNAVVDLLALQQPVASDLRFILAAMKINNDLERIGDHAVNIAESAISCAARPPLQVTLELPRMGVFTQTMLKDTLDGFIHRDAAVCRAVLQSDDVIDEMNKKIFLDLESVIRSDPSSIEQALDLIRVSRNLERIADLTTNIAEEVIFVAEAQVVKHHIEKRTPGR